MNTSVFRPKTTKHDDSNSELELDVFVEIAKSSHIKYEYDKEKRL